MCLFLDMVVLVLVGKHDKIEEMPAALINLSCLAYAQASTVKA